MTKEADKVLLKKVTRLSPQVPAVGVLKNGDYGDTKFYTIVCDCGQQDCAHELMIELDHNLFSVTTYVRASSRWTDKNRWKQLWQILTKGYVDVHAQIYMDKQTTVNYAATLEEAVEESYREQAARN